MFRKICAFMVLYPVFVVAMDPNDPIAIPSQALHPDKEAHLQRDISLVEAFMSSSFEVTVAKNEASINCTDFSNRLVTYNNIPLRTMALVLYQTRRDRAQVTAFCGALKQLTQKLFNDADDALSLEDIMLIQGYRLLQFDSPARELPDHRATLMGAMRKTVEGETFKERDKKLSAYEAELNSQYNAIVANRHAYNTAVCLADGELVATHQKEPMRYKEKPLVSIKDSIKAVRQLCRNQHNPFKLTEF